MGDRQLDISMLGRAALEGRALSREEALFLALAEDEALEEVFVWADRIRRKHFGNRVRFCSIVPGKLGGCAEDCAWCAQSAHRKAAKVKVYSKANPAPVSAKAGRTELSAIVEAARRAKTDGAACFCVVNSGRRPSADDLSFLREVNKTLVSAGLEPACASMGELTESTARALREMGVRRYNHNLETSPRHFPRLVSTHCFEDRLATLRAARAAGLEICCGGLFGAGETWLDRVDLALILRDEVRPDIVPLNFLSPIPGTPLENFSDLSPLECLQIIALFRFVLPATEIKIAGGRAQNLRDLQSWVFRAGATSLLVGNYLTTSGRDVAADRRMVEDLGLEVVSGYHTMT